MFGIHFTLDGADGDNDTTSSSDAGSPVASRSHPRSWASANGNNRRPKRGSGQRRHASAVSYPAVGDSDSDEDEGIEAHTPAGKLKRRWTDPNLSHEVRWTERAHERLEQDFLRDAPRTKLCIDGEAVTDYKAAFWRILRHFGWQMGARVLYMCTGDALAKSYRRGRKMIEVRNPEEGVLFVQCREHQENKIDTATGVFTLSKCFQLIRLEPYCVEDKWRLLKTFTVEENNSVDTWTREAVAPSDSIADRVKVGPAPSDLPDGRDSQATPTPQDGGNCAAAATASCTVEIAIDDDRDRSDTLIDMRPLDMSLSSCIAHLEASVATGTVHRAPDKTSLLDLSKGSSGGSGDDILGDSDAASVDGGHDVTPATSPESTPGRPGRPGRHDEAQHTSELLLLFPENEWDLDMGLIPDFSEHTRACRSPCVSPYSMADGLASLDDTMTPSVAEVTKPILKPTPKKTSTIRQIFRAFLDI